AMGLPISVIAFPQCAMAQAGSASATPSKAARAASNQKECSIATASLNGSATAGAHEVVKVTVPSVPASPAGWSCSCPAAGTTRGGATTAAARRARGRREEEGGRVVIGTSVQAWRQVVVRAGLRHGNRCTDAQDPPGGGRTRNAHTTHPPDGGQRLREAKMLAPPPGICILNKFGSALAGGSHPLHLHGQARLLHQLPAPAA